MLDSALRFRGVPKVDTKPPVEPPVEPPVTTVNQRDANKAIVLDTLTKLKATQKEKELVTFVGYAESDYDNTAVDQNQTFGIFQQDPRWWGTKEEILNIPKATESILNALQKVPRQSDPVADVWQVQNWTGDVKPELSSPFGSVEAKTRWESDPRTANYRRRVGDIPELITNPNFYADRGIK